MKLISHNDIKMKTLTKNFLLKMDESSVRYFMKKQNAAENAKVIDFIMNLPTSEEELPNAPLSVSDVMIVDSLYILKNNPELLENLSDIKTYTDLVFSSKAFDESKVRFQETLNTFQGLTTKQVNGDYQCPRCLNYSVVNETRQTRSGDEASTVISRCTYCGHTVKN